VRGDALPPHARSRDRRAQHLRAVDVLATWNSLGRDPREDPGEGRGTGHGYAREAAEPYQTGVAPAHLTGCPRCPIRCVVVVHRRHGSSTT
jgi:hypothetical protein